MTEWSDVVFSEVLCGAIEPPPHGAVAVLGDGAGGAVGAVLAFSCDHGYEVVGPPAIHCGVDGQWNGSVPVCQGKAVTPPSFLRAA